MNHIYNVDLTWNAGRKGLMCSPELKVEGGPSNCIDVATPPEFPSGVRGVWSPEHLFTAAVNSCFMTTFLAIAEKSRLAFSSFQCRSEGKLEDVEGRLQMSEVILYPRLAINNYQDAEKALRILQKAEGNCLITNSVKSVVTLNPTIDFIENDVAEKITT